MRQKNLISFLFTPLIILFILLFVELDPSNPLVTYTFCVALLMAVCGRVLCLRFVRSSVDPN